MDVITLGILLTFITKAIATSFNMAHSGLTEIPHNSISASVTKIILNNNDITQLTYGEFSQYTELFELNLLFNEITDIANDAFCGTSLKHVYLGGNELTDFPNFSCVRDTLLTLKLWTNKIVSISKEQLDLPQLYSLAISNNPITVWPDFSLMGVEMDSHKDLYFRNGQTLPSLKSIPTPFCDMYFVELSLQPYSIVPYINCSSSNSSLNTLKLEGKRYDDSTDLHDLVNLADIDSFTSLIMIKNSFTTFPDLPLALRQKLKTLDLHGCDIESIDAERINGFNLDFLDLSENKLTSLPLDLLKITAKLDMSEVSTVTDWSKGTWAQLFCNSEYEQLNQLDISGTLTNLVKFPMLDGYPCRENIKLDINLGPVS